jgi:hypothetical protein
VIPLAFAAAHGIEAGGLAIARGVVRRQLEAKLGGHVSFARFALRRDGIDLGGVVMDGRPDAIGARVESAHIAADWRELSRGAVRVTGIALDGVTLTQHAGGARTERMTVSPASLDRTSRGMHRDGLEWISFRRGDVQLDGGREPIAAHGVEGRVRFESERTRIVARAANIDAQGEHVTGAKIVGSIDGDGIVADAAAASLLGGSADAHIAYETRHASMRVHVESNGVQVAAIARHASLARGSLDGAVGGEGDIEFVDGEFRNAQARLTVRGAAVDIGARDFQGDVALSLDAVRDRIKVAELRTTTRGMRLAADLVFLRDDASHWVARTRGVLHAEGDAITRVAGYFGGAALQGGPVWRAQRADVTFDARSRLDDFTTATGSARVSLRGLNLRVGGMTTSLEIASLDTTIAPTPHGIVLRDLDARLRGFSVSGSLVLSGRTPLDVNRFRADATLDVRDFAAVQALAPSLPIWSQLTFDSASRARATLHASGALADRADRTVAANVSLDNVRVGRSLRMPNGQPLEATIVHATGDLDLTSRANGVDVALRNVNAQTSLGEVRGTATLANGRHHVEASASGIDARVARALLPGSILGGSGDGTLVLDGDASEPVRVARGRFTVRDARYVFPSELRLAGRAIRVERLDANYHWADGRAAITDMTLHSDLGDGVGSVNVVNGVPSLHANLTANNVAPVLDLFPALARMTERGRATATFDARFEATGMRGTLVAQIADGLVRIPQAPPDIAAQPIANGTIRMRFTPTSFAIDSLALRGPKANVDFHTNWDFAGAVSGGGRVWLTNAYSHDLMRGYNWLARLLGMRTLHSDFTIDGRPDRVMIRAGITHTLLWRLGRGRVPRNVQAVLSGHAPVGS